MIYLLMRSIALQKPVIAYLEKHIKIINCKK